MTEKELERIYNEAYKPVYWTAMQLLKNESDAEDIVQDIEIPHGLFSAPLAGVSDHPFRRICRAEGVLRHAHLLSAAEAVELMGLLRLGAAMGITRGIRVEVLNSLLTEAMPATLTLGVEPPPKNQTEEDALRARVVKDRVFGDT